MKITFSIAHLVIPRIYMVKLVTKGVYFSILILGFH